MKNIPQIIITRYKKFIIPLVLNLLTVFLVFWVIFPQIGQIPQQLSKIKTQTSQNKTLNESLSLLRSLPDSEVDENFTTVVSALPTTKDVALIFSSLSSAASASNTQVESFSLNAGGIFGRAAELSDTGTITTPTLSVIAQVGGASAASLTQFGSELTVRLPVAEIRNLGLANDSATYEIGFYYKPLDTAKIDRQDKIIPLSQSEINLLNQLKEWSR